MELMALMWTIDSESTQVSAGGLIIVSAQLNALDSSPTFISKEIS